MSDVQRLNRTAHPKRTDCLSGGFTIVESLIFLAISGALLISAIILVGGQQQRAEFNEAINEANSSITSIVNDVSNGFVPINGNLNCAANGTSLSLSSGGSDSFGNNGECIFIGKVLQTGVNGDENKFNTYTVAGRRLNGAQDVTSLDQALPTVIAPPNSTADTDKTDRNTFKWGLKAYRLVGIDGGPGINLSSVGFIGSFAKFSGTDPLANFEGTDLIGIAGSASDSEATVINGVSSLNTPAAVATAKNNVAQGVVLCVESADRTFKASITIGGTGQRVTTRLEIDNLAKECTT